MGLSDREIEFLTQHQSAAMITIGADGFAKTARIGVAVMDGRLWSSGTAGRVRTARLRRDPRATLFVFDSGFAWLNLETTVTIIEGPDVAAQTLRMMRQMQGRPEGPLQWFGGDLDDEEFERTMVEEQRLIYQFDVQRTYGMY